jgi:hypothetical protein
MLQPVKDMQHRRAEPVRIPDGQPAEEREGGREQGEQRYRSL